MVASRREDSLCIGQCFCMKYEVEIQGHEVSVDLDDRNGRVKACVGGRDYDIEVVRPEDDAYTFFCDGGVYEARVWQQEHNSMHVEIRGRGFSTAIIDRKHRRAVAEQGIEGRHSLTAP